MIIIFVRIKQLYFFYFNYIANKTYSQRIFNNMGRTTVIRLEVRPTAKLGWKFIIFLQQFQYSKILNEMKEKNSIEWNI